MAQLTNFPGNIQSASLYVADLDFSVTDSQLYDLFAQIGYVVSVRVCKDTTSGRSLGYGYVNYLNPLDAARAKQRLNSSTLNNKPILIMNSYDSSQISGTGNIFVKNLEKTINHKALHDIFSSFGNILSCKIAINSNGESKGYGFVQFETEEAARSAIVKSNGILINDKQVFVVPFRPKQEKDSAVNETKFTLRLHYIPIKHNLEAIHSTGQSVGYGILRLKSEGKAKIITKKNNDMVFKDKQLFVEMVSAVNKTKFNNVYVKNLAESVKEDDLKKIFGEYGIITSCVVMRYADGKSKCFGFANFENSDEAAKAVESLNGKKFDGKEWYVAKAQKKSEREQELKSRFEQTDGEVVDKYQGTNLFVKNMDDSIDDDRLKELFSEFGVITSCKVIYYPSGISKGFGFVAFSTSDEASRALSAMNGRMIMNKPLYVSLAERKEDRIAKLQDQFLQTGDGAMLSSVGPSIPMHTPGAPPAMIPEISESRAVTMPSSVSPSTPMHPPGALGMGHQLFYGQAPPTMIHQAGFGHLQQLAPGMNPRGPPMHDVFVPLVQAPGMHPGGLPMRNVFIPQVQSPVMQPGGLPMRNVFIPQVQPPGMLPGGWMYRYPSGGIMPPMAGVVGGMLPIPYSTGGMLPNAPPEQQRRMFGEN